MRTLLERHDDLVSPADDATVQLGAPGELLVTTRAGGTLRARRHLAPVVPTSPWRSPLRRNDTLCEVAPDRAR